MKQFDFENADRNLTSAVTVLTHTPDASNTTMCFVQINFGDGTKNLSGAEVEIEIVVTVGGQTVQPSPQTVGFSTAVRSMVFTAPFPVPANHQVVVTAKSSAAADTDVDVTAYLFGGYHLESVDSGDTMVGRKGSGSHTLTTLNAQIESYGGDGLYAGTVTVTTGGNAVQGATVHAYDGASTLIAIGTTDASGQVALTIDGAVTFSVAKAGYLTATATKTITGAGWTQAIAMTPPTITPSAPGLCTLWGVCFDEDDAVEAGVEVTCKHVSPPSGDTGTVASVDNATAVSGADGVFQFTGRLQGWTYKITRGASSKTVVVGAGTTQAIGSFVG